MFLDRTDLSKTVDRHGTGRVMSCPVPPDFWQPFFLNGSPFLLNEALFLQKTAEKGKSRPGQTRTGRSSLSEYSNSTSFSVATSFFHVFTPFFLCFWPVYNRSRVYQNTVKGLSTLVQESVEAVQGPFLYFSHQNLFTDG